MTSVTFNFFGYKKTRKGKCAVCGKRMQETRDFKQSLNPYNRNADGTQKSVADILRQEQEKYDAWTEPLVHPWCRKGRTGE